MLAHGVGRGLQYEVLGVGFEVGVLGEGQPGQVAHPSDTANIHTGLVQHPTVVGRECVQLLT